MHGQLRQEEVTLREALGAFAGSSPFRLGLQPQVSIWEEQRRRPTLCARLLPFPTCPVTWRRSGGKKEFALCLLTGVRQSRRYQRKEAQLCPCKGSVLLFTDLSGKPLTFYI